MAKRRTKEQKIADARIQNAVYGFSIPMMSIPALYKQLEQAIEVGVSDEDLQNLIANFPGVKRTVERNVAQQGQCIHNVNKNDCALCKPGAHGENLMAKDTVRFSTLTPAGESNVRTIKHSDIGKCPHVIFMPEHYRDDGSCKCNDPNETVMREWGYRWNKRLQRWA